MPRVGRKRSQWPPSPLVEDEATSLSRELHGMSMLGEKPGIEGVCARGTIDQWPVILDVPISEFSRVKQYDLNECSRGNSSSEDSTGPATPPEGFVQDPLLHVVDDSREFHWTPPTMSVPLPVKETRSRSQPSKERQPPKTSQHTDSSRQRMEPSRAIPRSQSAHAKKNTDMTATTQAPPRNLERVSVPAGAGQGPIGRPVEKTTSAAVPERSSVRNERRQSPAESQQSRSSAGYISDSAPNKPSMNPGTHQEPPPRALERVSVPARHGQGSLVRPAEKTSSAAIPERSSVRNERRQSPAESQQTRSSAGYLSESAANKSPMNPETMHQAPRSLDRVSVPARDGQGLGRLAEKTTSAPVPKPSVSVRHEPRQSPFESQQPRSSTGHVSGSAVNKSQRNPETVHQEPLSQPSKRTHGAPPTVSGLAERLEEKLRQRQKHRESENSARESGLPLARPGPTEPQSTEPPRAPQPTAPPEPVSRATFRGARSRAMSTPAKPMPAVPCSEDLDLLPASFRTATWDATPAVSPQSTTKRTVSFSDEERERERSRSSRRTSPSKAVVRQPSPEEASACLLPCPRSVPMTGYQDWYTIKGLEHLDICPSCMKQMRNSRFQDSFIPGLPVPRGQRVRCSMSEPWARLAWAQTINKQYETLDMLQQITRPPPGSKPCTGRIISDQFWYRIIDPETGVYLPNFNVCSACIRNLRILMPQHRETFMRSTTMQEQVCDFVADSPRFVQYIDLLDIAANRAELERSPRADVSEFLAYARRKVVLRDCSRDRPVLDMWYYMPQLPEFTVCEDCYDDVVWPLVKAGKPIAREFPSMMRLAPGDAPNRCREASCQLYSPRIRAKFRDAVQRNDLVYLKLIALKRYDVEQQIRERREELLEEERKGYDCDAELRRTLLEWRRWE